MRDLPVGTIIGPYRIRGVAGRGAVGIVYHGVHEEHGQAVAIKTLNPSFAGEDVFRERFSREAEGAASVHHPNIIEVFDAGEYEGTPYLVMTYVAGPDLEKVLADHGGRLAPAEAVLICGLMADALDAAATQGLAHRDVKPANILLEGWQPEKYGGRRRQPHAYLTDFGLIKSSAQATMTRTGQFVGTLLYMSPEQIQSKATPASDQYSLACVLWECLTGTLPFLPTGGSTLSLLSAHLTDPVPAFHTQPGGPWPRGLDAVFQRALAKSPADRYPTCTAFMDDVTRTLGLGTETPRVTPSPPLSATGRIPTSATGAPSPADPPPVTPPSERVYTPPPTGGPFAQAPTGTTPQPGAAQFPAGLPPGLPGGLPPGLPPSAVPPKQDSGKGPLIALAVVLLLAAAVVVAVIALSGGS